METGNFLKMLNDASLASLGILMWKVLGCTICKNPLWVLSCKVNPLRCQTNNAISEVSKGDCIIMGDFNHGNIKWDTLHSTGVEDQQFLCLVQDNFLTQHVLEPTRATRVLYIVLSWITNGLKNACRKKNRLYKIWLHSQTPAAESRYKIYKNKLTSILRAAEKEHYSKLLSDAKGNIKDTWKILNAAMNKKKISTEFPRQFLIKWDKYCQQTNHC